MQNTQRNFWKIVEFTVPVDFCVDSYIIDSYNVFLHIGQFLFSYLVKLSEIKLIVLCLLFQDGEMLYNTSLKFLS
jgi:hypothetical protein